MNYIDEKLATAEERHEREEIEKLQKLKIHDQKVEAVRQKKVKTPDGSEDKKHRQLIEL